MTWFRYACLLCVRSRSIKKTPCEVYIFGSFRSRQDTQSLLVPGCHHSAARTQPEHRHEGAGQGPPSTGKVVRIAEHVRGACWTADGCHVSCHLRHQGAWVHRRPKCREHHALGLPMGLWPGRPVPCTQCHIVEPVTGCPDSGCWGPGCVPEWLCCGAPHTPDTHSCILAVWDKLDARKSHYVSSFSFRCSCSGKHRVSAIPHQRRVHGARCNCGISGVLLDSRFVVVMQQKRTCR